MKKVNNLVPNEELMFLFNRGENFQSYNLFGAHICDDGCNFSVWAPNAEAVSVVCDMNGWDNSTHRMKKHENTGVWSIFIPEINIGERYKYCIETKNGELLYKADPYSFESEVRPATASVVSDMEYCWGDLKWMRKREKTPPYSEPINIYEVHLGSWRTHSDGRFYSYTEMAEELVPYVKEMGYTHIELMPICEYPFDGSWGYQTGGYYSANSRYGSPVELKAFIDRCHSQGIGVIADWVPAHFPKDTHGLAKFDGTCLYENSDTRLGEHKEWGTLVFDWGKTEVHSFLISNAIFWLEEYHIDGLRVDAVSSMLYRDYNRSEGEWLPNCYGGKENLEAVEFLQKLNTQVFLRFPNVLMIAEESTAWEGVTRPAHLGGLGFNFKWNMGWMNDVLRFMGMDPYFRGDNHNMLTFSMMYAFSENYILPLSHDEVVYGKGSLINKMYGEYQQKFKGLKLLLMYMYAHPGKKLIFMGGEIGQFDEWCFFKELEWGLLEYDMHRGLKTFAEDLNQYYKKSRSMYEVDNDWSGFKWINAEDRQNSVISFIRLSKSHRDRTIVVLNFSGVCHKKYNVGVPSAGEYEVVLESELKKYGGEKGCHRKITAKRHKYGEFDYTIEVDLPELSGIYIKKAKTIKRDK